MNTIFWSLELDFLLDGTIEAFRLLFSGDESTFSALYVSLVASTSSILIALFIGMPIGFFLGYFNFYGRDTLKSIADSLTAIPTVVIGLLLWSLLSYRGVFGDFNLLFTIKAIIIGQTILALPIIISLSSTVVLSMEKKIFFTLRTLGASGIKLLQGVIIEARFQLLGVAVVAYGRVISEIGISMMIGGNINYHTRTLTTAIALESGKGEFSRGIALGIILVSIAILVNFTILHIKKRSESRYAI